MYVGRHAAISMSAHFVCRIHSFVRSFMHSCRQVCTWSFATSWQGSWLVIGKEVRTSCTSLLPRYIFGVKGPSLTCDTACSSSLVAADAASWKQTRASGHSRSGRTRTVRIMLSPSECSYLLCARGTVFPSQGNSRRRPGCRNQPDSRYWPLHQLQQGRGSLV